MLDDQTTLADFFLQGDAPREPLDELEAGAVVSDLRARLTRQFDGMRWSAVWDAVKDQVEKLLDVRFVDIFLGAWTKYQALRKYCDPSQYPPDETHLVPLLEHTITSTHEPAIEITIGDAFRETIPFQIKLSLKLSGMLVQVRAGRILKVYAGRCQGDGSLQCSGVTLIERKTAEVHLPGMMDLGEGISLGPP